jgi:ABC-type sugar transport system ATPase subunit
MDGEVVSVESLGHEVLVRCTVPGGEVVVREQGSAPSHRAGERVGLHADPRHLHLFDATTSLRIDG